MIDRENLTEQMVFAAQKSGKYLKTERVHISDGQIESKSATDFVSYADRASQEILRQELKQIFPEAIFIAEEDGDPNIPGEYRWIVDPLDGTTNYLHGLPDYAVSIALEHRDQDIYKWGNIVAGVIYLPEFDLTFSAIKGKGSYCNDKKISVKERPISHGLLSHWWPMDRDKYLPQWLDLVSELLKKVTDIRNIGSPCVELCRLAEGKLDGFWAGAMEPWDLAAGILIVNEAGGKCSEPFGKTLLESEWIVAGTKNFHDLLVEQVKNYLKCYE